MRTTIEMKPEHRKRLLKLAADRGEKGFSGVVAEALELYLEAHRGRRKAIRQALSLKGSLGDEDGAELLNKTRKIQANWRWRHPYVCFDRLASGHVAADAASEIRRSLERTGNAIGMADSLIAGIVMSNGAALLTRNRRHFERIPVSSWFDTAGLTIALRNERR
jgi:hypothetical protein